MKDSRTGTSFYGDGPYLTDSNHLAELIRSDDMVAMIDFDDVIGATSKMYRDFICTQEYKKVSEFAELNLEWNDEHSKDDFFYEDLILKDGIPLNRLDNGGELQLKIMHAFFDTYTSDIPPIKGAIETIQEMIAEGFKVACITSLRKKDGKARVECLRKMGLNIPVITVDGSKREVYRTLSAATEGLCLVIDDMKTNTVEAAEAANGIRAGGEGDESGTRLGKNKAGLPLCSMVFHDHERKKGMPEITIGSNFTSVADWEDVKSAKTYYMDRANVFLELSKRLNLPLEETFKLYQKARTLTGASYSAFIKEEGYSTNIDENEKNIILERTVEKFLQRIERITESPNMGARRAHTPPMTK